MPYTITTKDGITINNIPDDVDPNSPELKARVAAIRSGGGEATASAPQMVSSHTVAPEMVPSHVPGAPLPESVPQAPAEPETTAAGIAGAVNRGLAPYAASLAAGPEGPAIVAGAKMLDPLAHGVNSLLEYFGVDPKHRQITPSEGMEMLMDKLGIYKPRTTAERIVQAGAEAAGGGLGTAKLGEALSKAEAPAVAGAGRMLAAQPVQQIAGSAGAGVASQAAAEAGAGPAGQIGAGLVGGILGAKVATPRAIIPPGGIAPSIAKTEATIAATQAERPAVAAQVNRPIAEPMLKSEALAEQAKRAAEGGLGSKRAMKVLAEQAAPNTKTIEAAKRLGIDEYLQPDHVTTNQAYRELAQAVKSIPGSEARAMEVTGLVKIGERADRLIHELGGTTDLSRVGEHVRNRIGDTVEKLTIQADDAYSALNTKIPKQTRGQTPTIIAFLEERAKDLDGVDNLSSLEKSVLKKLSPVLDENGVVVKEPTYALVDSVRRDIGAAAKAKGPFADADTGLAKHLYRLIDEDQMKIAESAGMGTQYEAAKKLVKVRKGFEDDLVALFGKKLDQSLVGKLETATASLSKGDADKIANIMKSIPADMRQEVATSAVKTAFGRSTQNGTLNFNTFSRWYEGLLGNKQAHAALMTNLTPEARKTFSDLYRVSKGVANASRERITTGRIMSVQQDIQGADSLLSNIYGVAKRSVFAIPMEAATTMMGLPGAGLSAAVSSALTKGKPNIMKAADKLISSNEFMQLASNPGQKQAQNMAKSGLFKRFATEAKLGLSDDEQRTIWIMNALRGQQATQQKQEK